MGGKTSTSTSQVQIPPEVLARYNSVNTTAQNVAQTPFQQYSTNPNAFVAPITPTQQYGIQNTNAAAGEAQPYYGAATGFALAGSQAVNPSQVDAGAINRYENPYLQQVLGATSAQINQNNQQAQAGQTGSAINQGYFGGDRSGIASAVLQGQQNLAAGQVYSGIESDAYQQALAAAQQQQGVGLEAAQANRAATQQTGQTLAELGTGAQGAALSGAQAQLGAGQVQQQTTQAGDTALYNQFLQQQSYPFQTAQFLANIAEGTGALSGNTTTSTTPGGLFSDERLKEDMEPIGKGFDGANIYRFRYKGDPTTRIGFSAQETERRHPEAVSEHGGFKAVDYGAATEDAARRGGFANAANDDFHEERRARQAGGMSGWGSYPPGVNPMSIGELLQAQAQMYGPGFGGAGLYGGSASSMPHGGSSYVPAPMQGSPMMIHGTTPPQRPQANPLHAAAQLGQDATGLQTDVHDAHQAYDWLKAPTQGQFLQNVVQNAATPDAGTVPFARGGFARAHRQDGGGFDPSDSQNDNPYQVHGGPGLNIPTADTQHPQLQTAKPPAPGGGGSGLSSLLGDASDIAGIAKAAPAIGSLASGIGTGIAGAAGGIGSTLASLLPLLALARGGRARFAAGGDPVEQALAGEDPDGPDPIENLLLRSGMHPANFEAGDPGLAAAAPETPAGGPGGPAAPAAGFAGAKPPGEPAAAAEAGFAGAKPGSTLAHIYGREGTAPNPHSSAIGVGQLLDGTYMGLLREAHPDVAAQVGNDPAAIKAFRRTPQGLALSAELAPMNQNKNRAILEHQGIPVTPTNEHVMWILGAGDGPKVLHADPATPLSGLISSAAIRANPSIMAGKTAGEFLGWARKGMNKGGFAGARHGYATDGLVVDPDAIDPTGGQADQLPAAPQIDPSLVEQAKQAATDPVVKQKVVENRVAAAQGDPSAPPAAQAAVADQQGTGGYTPADMGPGGGGFMTNAQRSQQLATDRADTVVGGQTQHPQGGGGFFSQAGHWLMQPEHAIPLATGIADMLAAPTKYPLVALTQGMKGGLDAYQQQRAYDAQTAMQEQERAQFGVGQATGAYQGATQRRQVNAQIAGQMLNAFDSQYQQVPGMMSEDNSGPKWLGPKGYITNSQHTALRQQIIQGTYGGIAQAGEGGGPMVAAPLITAGGGAGPPGVATGVQPPAVGTVPSPGAGAVGAGAVGAVAADGSPVGPQATGVSGGPAGAVRPPPGVGGGPAGGAGGVPAVAGTGAAPPQAPGGDQLDRRFQRGVYGNPVHLPPQLSPADAATTLQPNSNPYLLQQSGNDDQAQAIRSGVQPAFNLDGTEYTGFRDRAAAQTRYTAANEAAGAEWTRRQEMSRDFTQQAAIQQQYLDTLKNVYAGASFNVLSPEVARVVGSAASLPWVQQMVPDAVKTWQGQAATAAKMTAAQQLIAAAASHGAPASTLGVAATALPGPDQPPDARYSILFQNQAQLLQQEAKQQAEAKYGGNIGNWDQFDADFLRAHPLEEYESKVHMPFFKDQSLQSRVAHSFVPTQAEYQQLKPGDPYIKVVHGRRVIAQKGQQGG